VRADESIGQRSTVRHRLPESQGGHQGERYSAVCNSNGGEAPDALVKWVTNLAASGLAQLGQIVVEVQSWTGFNFICLVPSGMLEEGKAELNYVDEMREQTQEL
jgi:hypothetical protein